MPVHIPKAWVVFPAALVTWSTGIEAEPPPQEAVVAGGALGSGDILPPERPWNGKSRALLSDPADPWATPFEAKGGVATPRYEETVAWLRRLAEAAPEVKMVSLGKSPEGRDLWLVVASASGAGTPEALQAEGKPILLAQAGIHAGEIDAKDAGLMLLRDLTVRGTRRELLRDASFLFLPILNVDGHERFSAAGRINQRGPVECGWRTNSANFNLNRDYAKLDTPEIRQVIAALNVWDPDLYLDFHVSDGFDHQYDVTWTYDGPHAWSPNIAAWLDAGLSPALTADLRAMGHAPGTYVTALVDNDPAQGIRIMTSGPRFSEGYGSARHRATVLVETHALKPYVQRVLGTYVFMESALRTLGRHGRELEQVTLADRQLRPREVALQFVDAEPETDPMEFLGIRFRLTPSTVSGSLRQEWTGEPVTMRVPVVIQTKAGATVSRPRAYWIPPAWTEVIERLELHGIQMERQGDAHLVPITAYRIGNPRLDEQTYEGHVRVAGDPVRESRVERYPAGTVRVPTDQPLGDLAILLLEPGSPDSFFQWGFFLSVLRESEYAEAYVMEVLAAEMLARSDSLAAEFQEKLATDSTFAASPEARLGWFYHRTPYADERWRLYPVGREE